MAHQEEQNGASFSLVVPSSEELHCNIIVVHERVFSMFAYLAAHL